MSSSFKKLKLDASFMKFSKLLKGCLKTPFSFLLMKLHKKYPTCHRLHDLPIHVSFSTR
jgi:hypothetical protein